MKRTWGGTAALGTAVVLLAGLSGCGSEDDGGSSGGARDPLSVAHTWTEPDDYTYRLFSDCGERGGLGTFRITVRDGEATDVVDLGEEEMEPQWHGEPLTIGELLAEAQRALDEGAEVVDVELDGDGPRPASIDIDYSESALDDEVCYEMTEFTEN
jgi:hypothetical protein